MPGSPRLGLSACDRGAGHERRGRGKSGIGMSGQTRHGVCAPAEARAQSADGPCAKALLPVASLLAALATSSCCLLPFVLFTLGVSGAWIGNLTALAPYQPVFLAIAMASIGAGFYRVYRRPSAAACAPVSACADPRAGRITKAALWSATALAVTGVAVPWIVGLLVVT